MEKSNDLEKFKDLVDEVDFAMMITWDESRKLKARPMSTSQVDDEGCLWFFTNEYSGKVDQISQNNEVYLSYASPSKNTYLFIHAAAELNDDRNKMKELWKPAYKAWFKDGLDDPKLFLLKINPKNIEYWDSPDSKIVMAAGFLKSVLTGKEFKGGEHGTLNV